MKRIMIAIALVACIGACKKKEETGAGSASAKASGSGSAYRW